MSEWGVQACLAVVCEDWLVDLEVCREDKLPNWKLEATRGMDTRSGLSVP